MVCVCHCHSLLDTTIYISVYKGMSYVTNVNWFNGFDDKIDDAILKTTPKQMNIQYANNGQIKAL